MNLKDKVGIIGLALLGLSVISTNCMMWYVITTKIPSNGQVYCPDVHVLLNGDDMTGNNEEIHE